MRISNLRFHLIDNHQLHLFIGGFVPSSKVEAHLPVSVLFIPIFQFFFTFLL